MTSKVCSRCAKEKPLADFAKTQGNTDGRRGHCKRCDNEYYARRRVENYEVVRAYEKKAGRKSRLMRQYGLTLEDYEALALLQSHQCGICKELPLKKHHAVDHCHTTGKVRGLLCSTCNLALGLLKDSTQLLSHATDYLKRG